jgi:type I restriction enzyme S subunit
LHELREMVRALAVTGRLVAQDEKDEPTEILLERSDASRRAVARMDRRADGGQQTLLASDDRWPVPLSWAWRGLADLALFIDYRGQTPTKTDRGVRLITAKNVRPGVISRTPEEFISATNYDKWMTRGFPAGGDVLFTTEAPMGNAAVVRFTERFALAQRVICFSLYGALIPEFLTLQLLAVPFRNILWKTATGLTAKGIKGAKLKRLPVAVPPLAEQERIVAKVRELMSLCDDLEAQIEAGRVARAALLEATLRDALAECAESRVMDAEPA